MRRITAACLAVTTAVAVVDASDTHRVLIGLLAAGPLLAVLTRRARVTALVGLWAVALAVVLGVPDRMWATHKQAEYAGSIALVAGLSTTASAITERVTGTARIRG